MKILITSGNFAPEKTGIGKYTGEMAEWLAARGHEVHVITGFPYYPEWKLAAEYKRTGYRQEQWSGVTVHRVPHYIPKDGKVTTVRRMLVDLTMFLSSLPVWLKLMGQRRTRPDAIFAVCPPTLSCVWPWLASKLTGVPWIYHIQDFQVDAAMQLGMIKQGMMIRTLYAMENRLLQSAHRVSTITEAMRKRTISKGVAEKKTLLLPNWSDVNSIRPIDRLASFRRALRVGDEQVLFMYAGAMGRKQGLDLVLDAADALKSNPQIIFVMVGSGSDAAELQHQAAKRNLTNMHFLPLQPKAMLNEMLGSADVHLVVQKADAADLVMPSKLTNILAAGRPSLVTAAPVTQLWEATAGAGTGIAVTPGNLDAFVNAISALANDMSGRAVMGQRARQYAEENLAQDQILARFEQDLLYLIGCAPKPAMASMRAPAKIKPSSPSLPPAGESPRNAGERGPAPGPMRT
jgi:colanic acid biosynthesis glycosyl transferase WcaI